MSTADDATMMIGRRVGSYEIVAKLGEGGTGGVYRARDHKPDRTSRSRFWGDPISVDFTLHCTLRRDRNCRAEAALARTS